MGAAAASGGNDGGEEKELLGEVGTALDGLITGAVVSAARTDGAGGGCGIFVDASLAMRMACLTRAIAAAVATRASIKGSRGSAASRAALDCIIAGAELAAVVVSTRTWLVGVLADVWLAWWRTYLLNPTWYIVWVVGMIVWK